MKIEPFGTRVLIQPIKTNGEQKTASGLYMPNATDGKGVRPAKGKVLAVGPGGLDSRGTFVNVQAQVGDVVIYNQYAAQEVGFGAAEVLLVQDEMILGAIADE